MTNITNSFVAGKMNKDLDERLIPDGTYRDALNIDVDTDEGSNVGSARNSLGNTLTGGTISATNGRTIGAVKFEPNNLLYWLVASDTFDAIFEYNEITDTTQRVLKCTKATPTTASTLNFNQQYLVTAINYINGFLYWTDGLNPPRRVNIARAKAYTVDDAKIADDLQVILAPPLNPPTIRLFNDGTQANNISEKFLSFATRYKYLDGQYSALSPLSAIAFTPKTYELDYQAGNNKAMVNKYNSVKFTFSTGSVNVTDIQLVMYDTRSLNISVVETFNKVKLALIDNVYYSSFTFSNNKTYTILTSDQITRTFDNVPLLAEAQDFVGNRLMYGNYTQFYNIADTNKNNIKIDLSLNYISTDITNGTPTQTWRSDRDYEAAIEYLDNYGRHTTALTSVGNTTYIPAIQSDTSNSLLLNIKNKPPYWATGYRVLVKQSKKDYYNIFPITYYIDGLYRYFLINESDRDKFKVGEYVIFKSDKSGVTHSNKKYKILEFANKGTSFISGIISISGLYFKIKVGSAFELDNSGEYNYTWTGIGFGRVYTNIGEDIYPAPPIGVNPFGFIDNPIYYGSGDESALTLQNNNIQSYIYAARLQVIIDSISTFYYIFNGTVYPSINISYGVPIPINSNDGLLFTNIIINNGFNIGDRWTIMSRLDADFTQRAVAIVPGQNWSPSTPEVDRAIEVGAIITLNVIKDTYNSTQQAGPQIFPPSPARYANIEEWWYETLAYNQFIYYDQSGINIGSQKGDWNTAGIAFNRGKNWAMTAGTGGSNYANAIDTGGSISSETLKYPVRILLYSCVGPNNTELDDEYEGIGNNDQSEINFSFSISQSDTPTICETVGKDNSLDVYHEATKTYSITNGFHQTTWRFKDYTAPSYASGNTNLGQLNPNGIQSGTDQQHWFEVGDIVYFKLNGIATNIPYTVTYVPNAFNIVIDKPFVAGPIIAGTVSYNVNDIDQTNYGLAGQAVLKINNPGTINSTYNGWTFGNGLESDRIKDDFNAPELDLSPRVNAYIEDYKQMESPNAICYSGSYGEYTSLNRLNEFNLSNANFKYLDSEFGSIQKLYARDTDLVVFQENKVSKVLYGKNLMFDAAGGSTVTSIPEVLGTQIAYPSEWGISKNPESFAEWAGDVYFTDARRGSVLQMRGSVLQTSEDQIIPISAEGMTDYFRDLMRDAPNSQKLGGFDPYTRKYNLSANNISVSKCNLTLSRNSLTVPKLSGGGALAELFTIITDSSWSISLVNLGFGTSWLTGYTTSGYGTQDIIGLVAANNTSVVRRVKVVVTYCTSLTAEFILTQARGSKGNVFLIVRT
jgi:hypothetical protein